MSTTIAIDLRHVARGLGLSLSQVQAVVELLDDGNTVPFITRYRKDQTGGLDEEQIRQIQSRLTKLRQLADRKQTILRSIESQGKLTDALAQAILSANTTKRLEDLYLPFKPRKQTLATAARERGLEPLAREILAADPACADLDGRAKDFVNPDKKVPTAADALLGAGHILAEHFSEMAELRQRLRDILQRTGKIFSTRVATAESSKAAVPPAAAPALAPAPAVNRQTTAAPAESVPAAADSADSAPSNELTSGPPAAAPHAPENPRAAHPQTDIQHTQCAGETTEQAQATEQATEQTTEQAVEQAAELTAAHSAEQATEPAVEPSAEQPAQPAIEHPNKALPEQPAGEAIETPVEPAAPRPESDLPPAAVVEPSAAPPKTTAPEAAAPPAAVPSPADSVAVAAPTAPEAAVAEGATDAAAVATASATTTEGQTTAAATAAAGPAAAAPAVVPVPVRRTAAEKRAAAKARKAERKAAEREERRKKLEEIRLKAYRDYFDFSEEVRKIPPHRVLALNRGERAKMLRVRIEGDLEAMHAVLDEMLIPPGHPHADYLRGCARDALSRLILPSLERELRRELTDKAEAHAVEVFAKNLRKLLLQPPVRDRRVLAIDPGLRSGCKLAALDQFGSLLEHGVIFLVGKPDRRDEAKQKVVDLITRHQLTVIAIGNGTGCRQTEEFVAELLANELKESGAAYVIVNEAGASVYSTSPIGREELPQYDATLRGAISIGRRLLDPLSELVKIEPANLGVGLYQHDLKARHLQASLDEVVESCVNYVGVELNTASPALLRYVSGLNQLTARRVYEHRCKFGPFKTRRQLLEVNGFGEAAFVQAAGFLKISGGDDPLDATWIHPESYTVARALLEKLGFTPSDLNDKQKTAELDQRIAAIDRVALANELGAGLLTFNDILAQLTRVGRDPREDLPPPAFKKGVLKFEDLEAGMELTGTVLNVVDFGAFVDIGMRDSGLVHVSHMSERFIRDPHDVVAVGDAVRVWVLDVDKQRRRVSLTMLPPGTERMRRPARGEKPAEAAAPSGDPSPHAGPRPPRRAPRDGAPRTGGRRPDGEPPRSDARAGQRPAAPAQDGPHEQSGREQSGRGDEGGRRGDRDSGRRFSHDRRERGGPRQYDTSRSSQKPLVPLTEGMKKGKEPLRTFGDLLQFYQLKQQAAQQPDESSAADQQPTSGPAAEAAKGPAPPLDSNRPADSAAAPPTTANAATERLPAEPGANAAPTPDPSSPPTPEKNVAAAVGEPPSPASVEPHEDSPPTA